MRNRAFIAVLFAIAGVAEGQAVTRSFIAEQKVAVAPGGAFVVDNPIGNIDIIGGDGPDIVASALTTISGASAAAVEDGHRRVASIIGGDAKMRVFRASIPATHSADWDVTVDWTLHVPRSINVNVLSQVSERIRVMNISGDIRVKNFGGNVIIANATANTLVDSVNGSVAFTTPQLGPNTVLTSVNGSITANVPPDANIRWIAETAKGDIRTNLPARGMLVSNTYRGTINGDGGPTITTETLMGNVLLLANGSGLNQTRSVKQPAPAVRASTVSPSEPVEGVFEFHANMGDVFGPEVRGAADIFTGAGQVQLPKVTGGCKVFSKGGPLTLGDIGGVLDATTWAGDVTVERAARGGVVTTRGGTINIFYAKGPMRLQTDGGDIAVRRTTAPIKAHTLSGDIWVVIDRGSATEKVEARTDKGNVILHVPANFSAEVDATIVTNDPANDLFISDFPGLSITKEQIDGGKTRVRATGRINNGGQRLTLDAANGDIRITTAPPPPAPPRRGQ